ncbi:thiosulfate sulfurtransferase GlpE [Pseudomonas stutzeri]|uniref:thiosulfate sulfurtransferase GlpE n=1 Tax=Stutzerimonas stutzeri TaxID=316 RepID=UPI00190A66B6|nr:thiosulfate sulfurtransferase GlpE [Stutzerimonas stutzeri]MBK3866810.1 thiosulfate sulfurtransferase GlpE [Stutzerimonas stutzeri]
MSDYQRISVEQAQRLLATENAMLLDMRDAPAYCQGHDPRATRLSELNLRTLLKSTPNHVHLIICCERGHASRDMAQLFSDFGFINCYSLDGGYEAWKARPQQARPNQRAHTAHYALAME